MTDKFDDFLSKTLKSAAIEVNTPMEELEQKISQQVAINQRKKRKKQLRILQVAASVIILLGITGAVLFPQPVYAFKKQLFQTILNLGKSINISLSSDANRPRSYNKMEADLNALQAKVPFKILTPRYCPPGFDFESVKLSSHDEQTTIIIAFASENSSVLFSQSKIKGKFNYSVNIDAQQAKTKKIQIGKYEANLITFNNGYCSLNWLTDDKVMCQLYGSLSPEQIQEIAISMQ